jgi:hypothetical protein
MSVTKGNRLGFVTLLLPPDFQWCFASLIATGVESYLALFADNLAAKVSIRPRHGVGPPFAAGSRFEAEFVHLGGEVRLWPSTEPVSSGRNL